jgi:DNA-binding NtrC family response regulator
MNKLLAVIRRVAPTDSTLLIYGPTGTGKELLARAVHHQSNRHAGPFIDINCSAIPDTLFEAELFGHVRGSFTGAHETRRGLFEVASGGTLFLDEVDSINLSVQAKLLRVLQERAVRRIGGRENLPVNVRVIAATNNDLQQAVKEGRFRADLLYRLSIIPLRVPALYEREGDIPLLVEHFLARHHEQRQGPRREFTTEAMNALCQYPWPGNVRELENAIEYALTISETETLGLDSLPDNIALNSGQLASLDAKDLLDDFAKGRIPLAEVERRYILSVLAQFQGNQVRAANALGINRSKLHRRLQEYGVHIARFLQDEDSEGRQLLAADE